MEKSATHGVLELDSLEMLELIVGAEGDCRDAFPELAEQLDLSEIMVETWKAALPELQALFPLHWKEIALYQAEIPMDLNVEHYQRIEDLGMLLLLTARVSEAVYDQYNRKIGTEKRLVGYYVGYLMPHPHYQSAGPWATTDMYFILPEYRTGTGLKLFVAFEKIARAKGVKHGVTSCKVHADHTELLERLGWCWTDKTFQRHFS